MSIQVSCPACNSSFQTSDANAGKTGKCPKCSEPVLVPDAQEPEAKAEAKAERVRPQRPVRRSTRASGRSSARSSARELGDVEDLPTDAMPPAAIGAAAAAAVAGAAVWTFIALQFNYEIGWIAWGIGALVGTAAVRLGGRGMAMAAIAAGLALLGIAGGKYVSIDLATKKMIDEVAVQSTERAVYTDIVSDAKDFTDLPDDVTDEALANFMRTHEYADLDLVEELTPEDIADFREYSGPMLAEFHESPPTYEAWREDTEARVRADLASYISPTKDLFLESLGGISLFFAALGIATAWGLVNRAS